MKSPLFASAVVRILCCLALVPVLLFCVFGFLATFEPLPAGTQWLWRGIYGALGASCLFGAVRLLLPERH